MSFPSLPTMLGPYQLLEELGAGGMATVYRAHQPSTDRQVAVKVIYQELADAAGREQFQREARLIARLEHPHILPVYDFDGNHTPPYIVMRHLGGETLKEVLARPDLRVGTHLHWRMCLHWLQQVADALDYAHRQGIIHRDLKPSNVVLDSEGNAFLADFGIALLAEEMLALSGAELMGTPLYASPELAKGMEVVGPASDLYALAVVAFELFTQSPPFEAPTLSELLVKHAHTPPPLITERNPALPSQTDSIFYKALAKKPSERYPTATEFINTLTNLLNFSLTPNPIAHFIRPNPLLQRKPPPTRDEQNKVVTVLYADATEYAELLAEQQGPEATQQALRTFWEQVENIIHTRTGHCVEQSATSLLAVWGLPAPAEEDAVRAVHAALDIHTALQAVCPPGWANPLPLKMGLHTGNALHSPEAALHGRPIVAGTTLALAKRLADNAEGAALITHATFREVYGVFDMLPAIPIKVRGRKEPVATYEVTGAKTRAFRVKPFNVEGVETRLIGREAELKHLQNAYLNTIEDHETQVITLVGAPGLGKTRLLAEFERWSELRPEVYRIFQGRATPAMTARSYSLWRDVIAFRFQVLDSDPPAVVTQKMESGLAELLELDPAQRPTAAQTEMAHLVGHLVGFDFSQSQYVRGLLGEPKQLVARARQLLIRLFERVTAIDPVVLLLEDLHCADDASLDLLNDLIKAQPPLRLMVAAVARPALLERRPSWGQGQPFHKRLLLEPLDKRASRDLVQEILQKLPQVPRSLRDLLVDRAEGNPLFMEELVKMLLEDRILLRDARSPADPDPGWRLEESRLGHLRVPPSLASLLQARFETLLYPEKLTLQRAAVIGRTFFDTALQALDAADEVHLPDLPEVLKRLTERGFITPHDTSAFAGSVEYTFVQAMVRDQIYASLVKRQLKVYHAAQSHWLAQSERSNEHLALIAEHYERAGEKALAVEYLMRAANNALHLSAYAEVKSLAERGLGLLTETNAQHALLLRLLGQAGWGLGDYPTGLRHYGVSLRLCTVNNDRLGQADSWLGLGMIARSQGDYVSGERHLRSSLELYRALDNNLGTANALCELAVVARAKGDYAVERQCYEESLQIYRALNEQHGVATALTGLGLVARTEGHYAEAQHLLEESLALNRAVGNQWGIAYSLNSLGYLVGLQKDFAAAERLLLESIVIARDLNTRWSIASALNQLGYVYRFQGKYATAAPVFAESLALCREIHDQWGVAVCLTGMGYVALGASQPEQARAHFCEGLRLAMQIPVLQVALEILAGLAELEAQAGHPTRALEWLGLAFHHPASRRETYFEAECLLATLKTQLPSGEVEAALARGQALALEKVVAELVPQKGPVLDMLI